MPQAVMSAGLALTPDLLLAGVRPDQGLTCCDRGPSAGEVGEPAAVQLGFDDHGLGEI